MGKKFAVRSLSRDKGGVISGKLVGFFNRKVGGVVRMAKINVSKVKTKS